VVLYGQQPTEVLIRWNRFEDEVTGNGSSAAGSEIQVYSNIVLTEDQYSLVVRGKPAVGSWFYQNCLARNSQDAAKQVSELALLKALLIITADTGLIL
jgi:hypothetical protein